MCSGFPYSSIGTVVNAASMNVTLCNPVSATFFTPTTFTVTARAAQAAPPDRSCGWLWSSATFGSAGAFSIDAGDGLPVELMDFSVEGDLPQP